jgi:short-subunit dehydrogenase
MAIPAPRPGATALVTGASSGIGAQFARQLARRGHHVTLVARRRGRLELLADELAPNALVVAADLSEPGQRDGVAEAIEAAGLAVDVLVNCAGFGIYKPFAESERTHELEEIRLLVEAVVDFSSRYTPGMAERRSGCVINMSSVAAFQPLPYNATYAAGKAFVLRLSEALHAELRDRGVSVTAVCPGPVPTEYQKVSNAEFADRFPAITWASAERAVADALAAAEAGKRTVIPGGPAVRAAFAPNRFIPTPVALALFARMMAPS